ncbi:MAG TPA: peptidylprolyl isomerase, partial [Candidatus Enterocola sp.]|nr:peptidylprolyl isomerase [Candidatus Enterocola sp.]
MKKTTYITFLLICITSLMPILSSNQIIDQVVWVIGDEPILKSDIETEILRMRYEKQSIDGDPYCVIPEQIAIQKLFIAQAKLDSITVSEASVEQQVEGRIKYFIQRIGSKEKVEEYFNKPIAKIKEEMTRTVEEQLLVQEMQQKITSSNKITPADVKRFYNELPKDINWHFIGHLQT